MEKRKKPFQTHEAQLLVRPLGGKGIVEFMEMHDDKAAETVLRGAVKGEPNLFHVTVTYGAHGADLSDIMRPYRTTKWKKVADVVCESSRKLESV